MGGSDVHAAAALPVKRDAARHAVRAVLAASWFGLSVAAAAADYPRIELRYAGPPADGLDGMLIELRRVAEARTLTAMRPHLGEVLFWERDFGGAYSERDSALTNLVTAFSLDDTQLQPEHRGAGWARLSDILRAGTVSAHAEREGVACLPGEPAFADEMALQRAFEATGSGEDLFQWGFVEDRQVAVHGRGDAGGPVIAMLRSEAVFLHEWGEEWAEVELPDGRKGFVRSVDLRTASPERLCFGRDGSGVWKIVGYVGGGD